MFSKSCEYGIKAMIFIAQQSQKKQRVALKEIANAIDSPEAFTAKILQALARNNIIVSMKGANGGYEVDLNKPITLLAIVTAIDGDKIYNGCALGLRECGDDKPCPMHHEFKVIRANLKQTLQNTSLYQLTQGLNDGLTFLKQ